MAIAGGVGFIVGGGARAASGSRSSLSSDESRCAAPSPVSLWTWSPAITGIREPAADQIGEQAIAMDTMTTREQISAIQTERDDARQNLRDTLSDVNDKVERAEDEMRPDHIIESHSVGAALIAGALGFVFGSVVTGRGAGPIVIAALLGVAMSKHGSNDESEVQASRVIP